MQTGVLRALRAITASCRRHKDKELRRTGKTDLARQLEREVVRRNLGHLKQATRLPNAYVICGEGGTFLHLGWTTVSTLAPIERFPLAALAVAGGTPFIDIRPITDVIAFANLPRVTWDGSVDPKPWGPNSHVPLTTYLDLITNLLSWDIPFGELVSSQPNARRIKAGIPYNEGNAKSASLSEDDSLAENMQRANRAYTVGLFLFSRGRFAGLEPIGYISTHEFHTSHFKGFDPCPGFRLTQCSDERNMPGIEPIAKRTSQGNQGNPSVHQVGNGTVGRAVFHRVATDAQELA